MSSIYLIQQIYLRSFDPNCQRRDWRSLWMRQIDEELHFLEQIQLMDKRNVEQVLNDGYLHCTLGPLLLWTIDFSCYWRFLKMAFVLITCEM
jgi:hypothetical protein